MQTRTLQVRMEQGLHLRAAAEITTVARQYDAEITLSNGKVCADAKSLLSILLLDAAKGTVLLVRAHGADEGVAVVAMDTVFRYLAHHDRGVEASMAAGIVGSSPESPYSVFETGAFS